MASLKSKASKGEEETAEDDVEKEEGDTGAKLARTRAEVEAEEYVNATPLLEFDPAMVPLDALILVVGKRRYGKTVWSRWLLSNLWPYFREAYVFTTTKHNDFWSQHVPDEAIYEGLRWDVITQIMNRQRALVEIMKVQGKACNVVPHVALIFEDVASERSAMRYSEQIAKLAFMGRHYNMFMIFMLQDMKAMNADVRGNADFVALTYQTQARTMESAQEDWGDWWSNRWVFRELIRKHCQDHALLVVAQPHAVYKATDALYTSRAGDPEKLPPFRLGHYQQWEDCKCVWEKQLARYKKLHEVQVRPKDVMLRIAKEHLDKGEKERREQKNKNADAAPTVQTDQVDMAPDAIRAMAEDAQAKKAAGDGDSVSLARALVKRAKESAFDVGSTGNLF